MDRSDPYFYPATPETIHSYAASIFAPIRRGECVTTVWVPMSGRSMWNKFITQNIYLFDKELPNYRKYLLVYVEALDLTDESLNGYLQLLGKSILEAAKSNIKLFQKITSEEKEVFTKYGTLYPELLDGLRSILRKIANSGLTLVLFLGELDELNFTNKIFFNNLKSLWVSMYPNLQYVFPMVKSLTDPANMGVWDELKEPLLQNVIYVPLRTNNDVDYTLNFFLRRYSLKMEDQFKKASIRLCGGHPYMLKVAVRIYRNQGSFKEVKEFEDVLMNSHELNSAANGIFSVRSEIEQELLKKIVRKEVLDKDEEVQINALIKLGIVERINNTYKVFGLIYENFIKLLVDEDADTGIEGILDIDEGSGAIRFNGKLVDEYFTRQEYSILVLFLQKPNNIITRDDIGDILWGEDNYQKYSDWAIDQLISKLRKKIRKVGSNAKILTLRGRGYKFTQS